MKNLRQHKDDLAKHPKGARRALLAKLLERKKGGTAGGATTGRGAPTYEIPPEFRVVRGRMHALMDMVDDTIYDHLSEGLNNHLTVIDGREMINYCSYNYLGLSGHPETMDAAKAAIDQYGTSVSASRVASGDRPLHHDLEKAIAALIGAEDSVVFVGGYSTNESVIGHLFGPGDLILVDSLIHASVQEGCRLSGATVRPFPHNSHAALRNILARDRDNYERALIVIEGVYSMDGDIPDLPRYVELREQYGTFLMVDEAHSIGVLGEHGRGLSEHFGVDAGDVDLWMGTLSKAFASCGGYIAGRADLIEYLRLGSPAFVYSVGMTPPNAAAALSSIRLMLDEPERAAALHERAALFQRLCRERGLDTGTASGSAVVPVMVKQSKACARLYKALFDDGIYVLPIMYPTVPEGTARLRFFLSSTHTEDQITHTVDRVAVHLETITKDEGKLP